jgi:hypothetical protein
MLVKPAGIFSAVHGGGKHPVKFHPPTLATAAAAVACHRAFVSLSCFRGTFDRHNKSLANDPKQTSTSFR